MEAGMYSMDDWWLRVRAEAREHEAEPVKIDADAMRAQALQQARAAASTVVPGDAC